MPGAAGQPRWLRPAEVTQQLRKRWDRGDFLSDLAHHRAWVPLSVGLRPPTPREVADQFGAVQAWAQAWTGVSLAGTRVEFARIGGRAVGVNQVPVRWWIEDREALWRLLGVRSDVTTFADLVEETRVRRPDLLTWVAAHPRRTLEQVRQWSRLLAVVDWVEQRASPAVHLRQIEVPGVDTKFVEAHRAILGELLDHVLPPERVDETHPRSDFASRYRLARKPSYVRLRRLDGTPLLTGRGPAELGLRVADLASSPIEATTCYIVENDVTYLALPPVAGAIAILGEGYAVTRLAPVGWLAGRDLVYWGDLDTHGFVMLDRLRASFPSAASMLMDRTTLLDHEAHWGHEETPVNRPLGRLTSPESAVYQDLVEDRYGNHLRLEQERVSFGAVRAAMPGADDRAVTGAARLDSRQGGPPGQAPG